MKSVKVVGAVIVNDEGQVLAAQRPYSDVSYKSYKWEFPGGKIEDNESAEEAVVREIREELNCEIKVQRPLGEFEYQYPDFLLNLTLYECETTGCNPPEALEHHQIKWITPAEAESLDWIEADRKIVPQVFQNLNNPPSPSSL